MRAVVESRRKRSYRCDQDFHVLSADVQGNSHVSETTREIYKHYPKLNLAEVLY